jgi:hypothetical protein
MFPIIGVCPSIFVTRPRSSLQQLSKEKKILEYQHDSNLAVVGLTAWTSTTTTTTLLCCWLDPIYLSLLPYLIKKNETSPSRTCANLGGPIRFSAGSVGSRRWHHRPTFPLVFVKGMPILLISFLASTLDWILVFAQHLREIFLFWKLQLIHHSYCVILISCWYAELQPTQFMC